MPWPTSHDASGHSCQLRFSPVRWEQKLKARVGRLMLLPESGVAGQLFHPLPRLGFPSTVPSLSPLHAGLVPQRERPTRMALSPRPQPVPPPQRAVGLPVLPTPEPAVLQHQLVGRLGGACLRGGGTQGQRQGEGQQPHEERHGARGELAGVVRAPPPRPVPLISGRRGAGGRAGGWRREPRASPPRPLPAGQGCEAPLHFPGGQPSLPPSTPAPAPAPNLLTGTQATGLGRGWSEG